MHTLDAASLDMHIPVPDNDGVAEPRETGPSPSMEAFPLNGDSSDGGDNDDGDDDDTLNRMALEPLIRDELFLVDNLFIRGSAARIEEYVDPPREPPRVARLTRPLPPLPRVATPPAPPRRFSNGPDSDLVLAIVGSGGYAVNSVMGWPQGVTDTLSTVVEANTFADKLHDTVLPPPQDAQEDDDDDDDDGPPPLSAISD